jgi:hypothetical protein
LLAALAPALAPAQEAPPRPFLRKVIQLDEAQLATKENLKRARERLAAAR